MAPASFAGLAAVRSVAQVRLTLLLRERQHRNTSLSSS